MWVIHKYRNGSTRPLYVYNSPERLRIWILVLPFIFTVSLFLPIYSFAGDNSDKELSNRTLVDLFYQKRGGKACWFSPQPEAEELRRQLVLLIDACDQKGLDKCRYAYKPLKAYLQGDKLQPAAKVACERLYTDVTISFLRDIQRGTGMEAMLSYDEFSVNYKQKDDARLLDILDSIANGMPLKKAVEKLEPGTEEYRVLLASLKKAIDSGDLQRSSQLKTALNCRRWISHFGLKDYVIVNVPSGTLRYVRADTTLMNMKIVAGKPATPTPRFAAHCDKIILYPYWNVPDKIAVKEILPAVKRTSGLLTLLNMQVIDNRGNVIDPAAINWPAYNKRKFPYHFRQSTGCDNALGVIKFNLTSPFNVYLHDTNMKSAFAATKR